MIFHDDRAAQDRLLAPAPTGSASDPGARIPPLAPRFLEPPGFLWDSFVAPDGAILRCGRLPAAAPRAQCIVVGGFAECIEKYFETVRDLGARGLDVWCLDWRGQGGSQRPRRQPCRPRPRDYQRDATELALFAEARLSLRRPRLLFAHSMGGAIALLCLGRFPRLFEAAVLSAPMLGLRVGRLPIGCVRCLSSAARGLGFARALIPGARRWRPQRIPSPETSRVSSDAERCRLQYAWFAARPELRVDGPTFGWLDAAIRITARLARPEFLAGIATPILLGSPRIDQFVSPEAHRRVARLLPDCTLVDLPDSKHEPFLERDGIRDHWLAAIDRFLGERLAASALSPASSENGEATWRS